MSKRVLLGKFGTASGEYGIRVSKTGSDVINNDNTAVNPENLIFDSLNPVGSLGLYKVFLIEDVPANSGQNVSLATATAGHGQGGTPGSTTQVFGETLGFIPLAICQQVGSWHTTAGASYSTSVWNGWRSPSNGGYQDSEGFDDSGWYFVTTTSQITIYNYGTNTIDVRAALFYTPA